MVYGPTDHIRTYEFLAELSGAVATCPFPLVVGGDFNLIRGSADKNNDNINGPRLHKFDDFIATPAPWEVRRGEARYTWANKQLNPV